MSPLGGRFSGMHGTLNTYGLADSVFEAESSNRELADPDVLRAMGEQVLFHAQELGCVALVAASRSAESIVAAAILLGGGRVERFAILASPDRVLVVDSAIVTGHSTRTAIADLREAGADWLGALVMRRVRPDLDALDSAPLNAMVVLQS
jgi:hypothetical protein